MNQPIVVAGLSLVLLCAGRARAQEGEPIRSRPVSNEAEALIEASAEETVTEKTATEEGEPEEPRTSFNIRLNEERGGGRVKGSTGDMDYSPGAYLLLTGGVDLKYGDLRLQAERARVDIAANRLTAEGNVVLDEGPRRLTGQSLEWDLSTRTGRIQQATAYVDPSYYFSGDEIAKTAEAEYEIDEGVFTSCDDKVPDWSIQLSNARITVGEYARIRNARFKLKKLPVLYFPYVLWPARTERTSGFLMPKPGHSRRRGAYLGLAYFQTLGRSADATFFLDLYSKEFYGFGTQVRYRPSETSSGELQAYLLSEPSMLDEMDFPVFDIVNRVPGVGMERWRVDYYHESTDLWGGWRGVVDLEDYSDLDYLQEFERDPNTQTRPFIYSNAYLSRNFGQHSLTFLVDQNERIQRNGAETLHRQLPEIEYRLRSKRLGETPLYLSLLSSANYFNIRFRQPLGPGGQRLQDDVNFEYGRFDLLPTLSIPLSTIPWLSAKLDLSQRLTWYSDSLTDDGSDFRGESLTRSASIAALEVVGPSFSRIFEKKGEKGRFGKYKHIVEPRWSYLLVEDYGDGTRPFMEEVLPDMEVLEWERINRFDEVDSLLPSNGMAFALVNRLLAKPRDEEEGGAVEIASFEISQGYSFDDDLPGQFEQITVTDLVPVLDDDGNPVLGDDGEPLFEEEQKQIRVATNEGPIQATLRYNPSAKSSLKLESEYNTLFDQQTRLSLSGGTEIGRQGVGVTWSQRWRATDGEKRNDQLQLFTKFQLLPALALEEKGRALTLASEFRYDLELSEILAQRHFLTWQSQCYSLELEVREAQYGSGTNLVEDLDYRFSFTLKHVGKFLDMTGGLGSSSP